MTLLSRSTRDLLKSDDEALDHRVQIDLSERAPRELVASVGVSRGQSSPPHGARQGWTAGRSPRRPNHIYEMAPCRAPRG